MSGLPKGEPILIECEGSGSQTRFLPFISGRKHICPMCGQEVVPDTRGSAPSHKRDDLLARIKRGDFG